MQHLDIERFIEKANTVHNNKYEYEYENIIWKNVGTKITIRCKEHCDFKQTPSNHLMGKGCAYCSGVGRITPTIFLEKVIKIHNNKYKYKIDDTIKNNNNIEIICDTHGTFFQTPKNHLKGNVVLNVHYIINMTKMDLLKKQILFIIINMIIH